MPRRKAVFAVIIVLVFVACGLALQRYGHKTGARFNGAQNLRIVSLSPSLTDSLFTLGLGDNVVGVSQYCIYPEEARTRTVVGNLYDHNYELIVKLKPDIVVLNVDQEKAAEIFAALGVPVKVFDNRSVEGVFDTFTGLGQTFGKEAEAAAVVEQMRRRLDTYRELAASLPRVRTMVCLGRSMGTNSVTQAYVAAPHTYVGTLLEYAGGENVYTGSAAYPILSAEALIRLNPDVIIEMVPEVGQGLLNAQDIIIQWELLQEIAAVRNKRVYVLEEGYTVLPGPKLVFLLEDIMRVLYPALERG